MAGVKGPNPNLPRLPRQPQGAGNRNPKLPKSKQANRRSARIAANAEARADAAAEMEYLAPEAVDTDAEEQAAFNRKRAAEMDDEMRKNAHLEGMAEALKADEEDEEETRLKGLNWDEERKKRGWKQDDEEEDAEDAKEAAQAAKDAGITGAVGAGKYFQDMPEDRMGDLSLTDPNEIKRQLGPSVRFAQHAMVLAEERLKDGESREVALEYLASIYLGVADRAYAQKALKAFGPATGIISLYPLEVIDRLLTHVPGFFSKIERGSFTTNNKNACYKAKAGADIVLEYPADLRIRGFAIKGGASPGYILEPTDPPGTYRLVFQSPGSYPIMLSAIDKRGRVFIEEFNCEISRGDASVTFEDAQAIRREREEETSEEAAPAEAKEEKKDDLKINFRRFV